MKKIGFIGIGVMGKGMARNLMKAGYELTVYTRTKEKAGRLDPGGGPVGGIRLRSASGSRRQ